MTNEPSSMIKEKIEAITNEIAPAKLLVVTKMRSANEIGEVISAGVKYIGENTLKEIEKKYDHHLFRELQKREVELHYIGHLQTNKINKIVRLCDGIQSVDSLEKAEKVNLAAGNLKKVMPIFLELNITGEKQKHGINIPEGENGHSRPSTGEDVHHRLQELVTLLRQLPNLKLMGLMCIGKHGDPEETIKVFRRCKKLADQLNLPQTSMGMSEDYPLALAEGSTMVRIGSLIFE